jgi:hypothetical protein
MVSPAARQKNASVTGGGGLRPFLVESDVQRNQFLTVCGKRISVFDNLAFRWPIVSIPKKYDHFVLLLTFLIFLRAMFT